MKIWMDGELVEAEKATVSVFDHGLLYGDGVFEGLRCYSGRIFRGERHVKRLFDSARAVRLEIPYGPAQITEAMEATIAAAGCADCYIRLVVTRGDGTLGLNPFSCPRPRVFIIAGAIQLYPPELYKTGMSVITAATQRMANNALSPRIKSLNYLNNILAKIEAIDAGVGEAIMLNAAGMVAEASGDNVFIVKDGVLKTPPVSAGALEGVTRDAVLELAVDAGIPARECDITRFDLYTADECFLTGSAAEVIAVTQIDKRRIGDGEVGPITAQLLLAYHELIRRE